MANTGSSDLPPLYTNPVILNAKEHAALVFNRAASHNFARHVNSVPVVLSELMQLLPYYPIVFTTGKDPALIAILGARNDENLFVGPDGKWLPNMYIPAYVRRYPFILTKLPDDKLVLGADIDSEFFATEGEPVFVDNRPTDLAQTAFRFCVEFQQAFDATQLFCKAVSETGLLKNKRSSITTPRGAKFNLTGFAAVDGPALDELDNRTANNLRKQHWLGALYCHIASLERLKSFPQWLDERRTA